MKEELRRLIDKVATEKGWTMEEVSTNAGYSESYLSVQLSRGNPSKRLYGKVAALLDKNEVEIADGLKFLTQVAVKNLATGRVALSVLAELHARQNEYLVGELLESYQRLVEIEEEKIREEGKQAT